MTAASGERRSVLITGAANGIGAETARQLVDRGWNVTLVDVDHDALARTAAGLGDRALTVVADVTDGEAVRLAVDAGLRRFGRLDAVVANAAIEILGPVVTIPLDDARRVVDVNLFGPWETIRAALPALRAQRGYALFVTSVAAATQGPFNAAYGASKAGLVVLARTLRMEVRKDRVDIGIAYFGFVDTATGRGAVEHPSMGPIMAHSPRRMRQPVPVDRAAAALVRAIEHRSRRVVVPRSLAVAVEIPELAQRIGERALRRVNLDWSG